MNRAELRALVETILTSEDPSLRAGDRLRAAEMLRELDDRPSLDTLIRETTAEIPDEGLDAWSDSVLAALVLAHGDDEIRSRWPETARVLDERAWGQRA